MVLEWAIVSGVIVAFYLLVWWVFSPKSWAKKVVAFNDGKIASVVLVRFPFLRPVLSGTCHKNWRTTKDFWGRAVLCDRMGNRVVITENTPSSVVAMLFSESLLAFAAAGYESGEALREAKSAVVYYRDEQRKLNIAVGKRNRLLVLVVEAMRKSTDFQRLKVLFAIRENLLKRMKQELADDADLWKALRERAEEESLSEQATQ